MSLLADIVAKFGEEAVARNIRIEARRNQCCAPTTYLESMLLARTSKIQELLAGILKRWTIILTNQRGRPWKPNGFGMLQKGSPDYSSNAAGRTGHHR
jgi:hypothetical protein